MANRKKKTLNEEVITVLDHISRCARKYGFPAIIDKLKQMDVERGEFNAVFEYIFEIVIAEYGVSRKIICGRKRKEASEARKVCLLLLDTHTDLSDGQILEHFDGRSRTILISVWKEFDAIKNDPVTKDDKRFVTSFNTLNNKVLEYKKNNNIK